MNQQKICICVLLTFGVGFAQAEPQKKLKLGTLGHSLGFLQVDIAEAKGWMTTENLETERIYFKSGKDCATALLRGDLDAAVLGIDHAITGQLSGTEIRQTALLNQLPGWTFVCAAPLGERIKSPEDVAGLRVGVTSPGSATHILSTYLLSKHGVAPDSFTVVKAGSATLPDILRKGGIDVGMALEPYGSSLVASGDAKLLVDFRSAEATKTHLGSLYPLTALLVRQDSIAAKELAVQDLTTAMVWACKWIDEASADDVIALLPNEYIPEPDLWRKSFNASREVFPVDGKTDIEGINAVIAAQIVFGKLTAKSDVVVEDLYDNRFWDKAVSLPAPAFSVEGVKASGKRPEPSLVTILIASGLVVLAVCVFLFRGMIVKKKSESL